MMPTVQELIDEQLKRLDPANGAVPRDEHERAIAEAVVAERERNISACRKIEAGYIGARMGDCATASHRCAEAIRSAAK